jgi:hypothetical protein
MGIDCVHVGQATFEGENGCSRLGVGPSHLQFPGNSYLLQSAALSAERLGSTFSRLHCESVQKLEVEQTCCVFASDSEHNRLMRVFSEVSVSKQKF